MGREIRNFRQSKKGNNANSAAKNFARVNRSGSWGKVLNIFRKNKEVK